jgi:UDP-glucuronate 4-epimerase
MAGRILITGAAGFIGRRCAETAVKKGWDAVGIDNLNDFTYPARIKYQRLASLGLDTTSLMVGRSHSSIPHLDFHIVDCTDAATVGSMIVDGGFDVVLHLAGMTSVSASSLSPEVFFKNNLRGFVNVLEGVRALPEDKRPKLVFASSAAVYGSHDSPVSESDQNLLRPESIYGASKCMMERAAETYSRLYGVRSLGLRLFNIYGPFERPDTLISDAITSLLTGQPMELYDDGSCARDYMYIDDCVEAIGRACRQFLPAGSLFDLVNIGTGSAVTAVDLIKDLESITGRELTFINERIPSGEIKSLKSDPSKLERMFGVFPKVSLHEGLGRCVEWAKNGSGEFLK